MYDKRINAHNMSNKSLIAQVNKKGKLKKKRLTRVNDTV